MDIMQVFLAVLFFSLAIYAFRAGVLMMIDKKYRNKLADRWLQTDTKSGEEFNRKKVKIFNGPLTILISFVFLYSALAVLNLLPLGW